MRLQWNIIEAVTAQIEAEKPVLKVTLWHHPKYKVEVNFKESEKVREHVVFLGNFEKFDQREDMRYKTKYEELKKKYESLRFNYHASEKAIEKIKEYLKWL